MNEPTIFTISLDKNEIDVFLNLLDVACKAAGRSAAQAVSHFETKLKNATPAEPVESVEPVAKKE